MYDTYVKSQYCYHYDDNILHCSGPHANATRQIPSQLPKPTDFMPTRLVRISDMKVVQGSEINGGYCALSYSWSWCGDNIVDKSTGKTIRNDQGRHKIVFPPRRIRQKPRGRKIIPGKIKFVKFEGIIQQICKDFNIKYIWYDQKCINQDDQEEKQREIRQLHQIYNNAYCTMALVPEFRTLVGLYPYYSNQERPHSRRGYRNPDLSSLYCADWLTRAWTLEETVKSKRILLVGRDIHAWWYSIRRSPIISSLFQQPAEQNVCTILYYAHIRKCSKEHDRIFSLANIFPDAMDDIIIDYDQSLPELLICFYGILAKKDLSILCFGKWFTYGVFLGNEASRDTLLSLSNNFLKCYRHTKDVKYVSPIQDYSLPSWTGVAGEHIPPLLGFQKESYPTTTFQNYVVNGRFLVLTCPYVISSINYTNTSKNSDLYILRGKDLPPPPDEYDSFPSRYKHDNWKLAVSVQLSNSDNRNGVLALTGFTYYPRTIDKFEKLCSIKTIYNENIKAISRFFKIRKEDLFWWNSHTCSKEPHAKMSFSLTTEYDPSLSCIILTGAPFDYNKPNWKTYPILQKDGDYYKAIGTCKIKNIEHIFPGYMDNEKTFVIA